MNNGLQYVTKFMTLVWGGRLGARLWHLCRPSPFFNTKITPEVFQNGAKNTKQHQTIMPMDPKRSKSQPEGTSGTLAQRTARNVYNIIVSETDVCVCFRKHMFDAKTTFYAWKKTQLVLK